MFYHCSYHDRKNEYPITVSSSTVGQKGRKAKSAWNKSRCFYILKLNNLSDISHCIRVDLLYMKVFLSHYSITTHKTSWTFDCGCEGIINHKPEPIQHLEQCLLRNDQVWSLLNKYAFQQDMYRPPVDHIWGFGGGGGVAFWEEDAVVCLLKRGICLLALRVWGSADTPVDRMTDTRLWKHYLLATSFADSNHWLKLLHVDKV